MVTCCAVNCTNRSSRRKEGLTFHSFPQNRERRSTWILAVRRKNWNPTKHAKICSEHFKAEDFDRSSSLLVRLKEDAVPSVFQTFPSRLQKTLRDWKAYVRGKAKRIALHNNTTGGEPPCKEVFTPSDERLLALLAKTKNEEDRINEAPLQEDLTSDNDGLGEKIGNYLSVEMADEDAENEYTNNEGPFTPTLNHIIKRSQEESQMKKETVLTDVASKIMELQKEIFNSQRKILLVEERKADAALRKAAALERIATAKEREATAVEGMYFLKQQKLIENISRNKKQKTDET